MSNNRKVLFGQSIVEFAVVLPGMLMLIMGVLEIGRLFYIKVALQNAAREGAYYLSYYPDDFDGMKSAVANEAISAGVELDPNADIVLSHCCTRGEYVEVEVRQDDLSLLIFGYFTGKIDLSSTARMMGQ
jgi:hypothetical protein